LHLQSQARAAAKTVKSYGTASVGGPWVLVDTNGVVTSSQDLAGQYYLLYFGFTFCPDICPNELVKLASTINELSKMTGNLVHRN
jgi:protein SCO1/2